jgi:1,4-alpha-glucan branching enzyme
VGVLVGGRGDGRRRDTPEIVSLPIRLPFVPQKAEGGVLFQCYAPEARAVYLAGDFNGWANNVDGRITNAEFAMSGPDTNGVWRKTVKLDPGVYRFKFNLNGEASGWFAPDSIDELDGDKNAIIHVDASGDVVVRSAHNPRWRPQSDGTWCDPSVLRSGRVHRVSRRGFQ